MSDSAPPMPELIRTGESEAQEAARVRQDRRRRRALEITLQVSVFILLMLMWEFFVRWEWLDAFFFGQPTGVVRELWRWIHEGTSIGSLWLQVYVTLEETVYSFLIGVGLGVVAGFALGRSRLLSVIIGPYIRALNAIPRVVLGPIFIIWLGLGMASKVALGVTLTFFVVFYNVYQGVREVDRNLINNARVLGATERHIIWHVQLPSALTWIISSLHTSFGFALVGAVVGEFLGAMHGLGYLIAVAMGSFNPNGVYAAMLILSAAALAAEWGVTFLEHRLVAWRPVPSGDRPT